MAKRHPYSLVMPKFHLLPQLSLGEALIATLLIMSMTQGIWTAVGIHESMLKAVLESGFVVVFVLGIAQRLRSGKPLSGIKLTLPFCIAILIGLVSGAVQGASFCESLFYVRFLIIPLLFLIGIMNIQLAVSASRRLLLLITGLLLLQLPLFGYKWMVFGVEEKHWIGGLSQTAGQLGLIFPMLVLSMLLLLYLYRGGWFILYVMVYSLLPVVNEKRAVVVMLPSLIIAAIFAYSRLLWCHSGHQMDIPRITCGKLVSLFTVCIAVWITSVKVIPSFHCGDHQSCTVQVLQYGKDYLLRDYSSPMNVSKISVDQNTNIQMGRLKLIQESIGILADKGWGSLTFGLGGGSINPSFRIGPDREDILYKKFGVRGTYSYGLMLLWEGGIASVMAAAGFFLLLWLVVVRQLEKVDTPASLVFGYGIIVMLAVLAFDFFGYSTTGWLTHSVTPLVFILVAIFLRHGYPDKAD